MTPNGVEAEIELLQLKINRLKLENITLRKEQHLEPITIAEYILERLQQLDVRSMFGVPGDFFLRFLDFVEDHPTINWVGECNELNAAYAADGYARLKGSLGVVATTFGVGELSAINSIAGSYSESLPVLHIVGQPSTDQQNANEILHHTLGDGRYDAFSQCARQITYSQAILTKKDVAHGQAPEKIDQLLIDCITQSRPGYLTLPRDLIEAKVSSARLIVPLAPAYRINDNDSQETVIKRIYDLFKNAGADVVVIVDAGVVRHHCRGEVEQFLTETQLPFYATPMGKTVIDEGHKRYGGVYFGDISREEVKEKVKSAKLVLLIGPIKSNFNTAKYTGILPRHRTVELHFDLTVIRYATYFKVGMKQLLPMLTQSLKEFREQASQFPVPEFSNVVIQSSMPQITHAWFWPRVGQWFRPGDVVVTETGTANFGIIDVCMPGASLLAQMLWCSIGWSVSAAHGAALVLQEPGFVNNLLPPPRTILFIGDGSLQVTVQEISSMVHSRVKPIIFVLNNSGYTIERYIHGEDRAYNVLGDTTGNSSQAYRVTTIPEIETLLNNEEFNQANRIQLVEVVMDKMDAPESLKRFMDKWKEEEKKEEPELYRDDDA